MHESSIAVEICQIAGRIVGQQSLSRVRVVGVRVGDESGVEVTNLNFWLETLLSLPPFGGARPAIEREPGGEIRLSYIEVEEPEEEAIQSAGTHD